jgi:hypothetical protein
MHVLFRNAPVGAIFSGMAFREGGPFVKLNETEYRRYCVTDRAVLRAQPHELDFSVSYSKVCWRTAEKHQQMNKEAGEK